MRQIFLSLGSNLGDKSLNIFKSLAFLEKKVGAIVQKSALYETQPWGLQTQPNFYNMVIEVTSTLTPMAVLDQILAIEKEMGRIREVRWAKRLIDIDILYDDKLIINEASIKIPHPEIAYRKFVLIPLLEIAPDFVHPVLKLSTQELLQQCTDPLEVIKVKD